MKMYEKIGQIARDNWNCRWSFADLANELHLNSPWHAGQRVERAWDYFNRRAETYTCSAISRVFWSKDRC